MDRIVMRHLKKFSVLLAAVLVLGLEPIDGLAAQATPAAASNDTTPRWMAGATYVRVGTSTLGLDALNADLARSGRPTFSNAVLMLGISTHARLGRLLYGASIEQSIPRHALDAEWAMKLTAGGASLDAGLALMESSNTLVSSTISLGMRSTSLHFERPSDFTYPEGLEDPARSLDLVSRTGVAVLGVAVERHFQTRRTGTFTLAAEVGMTRPLGAPSTFAGDSHIAQTPKQTSGRYLRIGIGKPLTRRRNALRTVGAAVASMILR
jgi:hypothetical protein